MQIIVPLVVLLSIAGLLAAFAATREKKETRIIFCLAGMVIMSTIVASIIYPLGPYYFRVKAYQGNIEIKEFITDIQKDLASKDQKLAKEKIEFILEHWDETEFIENNPEYGTWIGDRVDKSKLLKYRTEPDAGGNG